MYLMTDETSSGKSFAHSVASCPVNTWYYLCSKNWKKKESHSHLDSSKVAALINRCGHTTMPRQKHGAIFANVNIRALLPLSLSYFRSGLSVVGKVQCVHKETKAWEGIAIARSEKDTLELSIFEFSSVTVLRYRL